VWGLSTEGKYDWLYISQVIQSFEREFFVFLRT